MKKYTSSFLAGLLILSVLLTSCRMDNSSVPLSGTQASDTEIADTVNSDEPVTRTTHLTGIFKSEALTPPKDVTYRRRYCPEYDENGNLTIFTYTVVNNEKQYSMLTLSPEGEILNLQHIIRELRRIFRCTRLCAVQSKRKTRKR